LSPIVPKNWVLTSYKLLLLTPFGFLKYTRSSEDYFINNTEINACLCFTLIFLFQNIFRVQIIVLAGKQPQRKVKSALETSREGGEVEKKSLGGTKGRGRRGTGRVNLARQ